MKRLAVLLSAALMLVPSLAAAASYSPKKVKKWPELDRAWARSFDVWMTAEEIEIFQKLATTPERQQFLEGTGYMKMWESIPEEMLPSVIEGKVLPGMTQDQVYMVWDKPLKIRKDFKKDAYVDVLHYDFEVDPKGREFLYLETSQTAYKNEILTRYVFMHNGKVFRVVKAGEEEGVLDDLLKQMQAERAAKDAAKPDVTADGLDDEPPEPTPAPSEPTPTP
jgi:hypothetical protein